MNNEFQMTSNVELFITLVSSLENRKFMPGMGLVCGDPGLGKSRTANWYCDQMAVKLGNERKPIFVRALTNDTPRTFLQRLVTELGQAPAYITADVYQQAEDILRELPRLLVVDEIEKLMSYWRGIETLRDLTDQTGIPILMIGEEESVRKLARFPRIHYRMKAHIMRFKPLNEIEVGQFAAKICEVELDESAINYAFEISGGKIGDILPELYRAEKIAKANNLKAVKKSHLLRKAA